MATTTKVRKPKKPTYKPMPKAPKMSASLDAWKRYKEQWDKVAAENLKKKQQYEKELAAVNAVTKAKETIKASIDKKRKVVPFGSRKKAA